MLYPKRLIFCWVHKGGKVNLFIKKMTLACIVFFFMNNCSEQQTVEQKTLEKNDQTKPSMIQSLYGDVTTKLQYAKAALSNTLFGTSTAILSSKDVTLPQAYNLVQEIFKGIPTEEPALNEYWRKNSAVLLRAIKVLYEESQKQILKILEEIDKRLLYWRYQKEHQLSYFFSKNPLKWVTGSSQHEEISANIEMLQNKQDELYARLGKLSAVDLHEYLMAFNNYKNAYLWMEKVCNILVGIVKDETTMADEGNYKVIVKELLERQII